MVTMRGPLILVHGAFQSAGTWDLVVPPLQDAGRQVIVVSLTGLEPDDILTETVTLDTHVQDVVGMLDRLPAGDAVLVGHSYGGMLITAAAARVPERIAHLVYIDALVPDRGQSAWDYFPERTRAFFRSLAEQGDGWRMRPDRRLLDIWGLDEGPARRFVEARLSDFPIRCFEDAIDLPANGDHRVPGTYVASTKPNYPARAVFEPCAAAARTRGWRYHELPCGHDSQAEMPAELTRILLEE
jgi:pimeloyl-ACP methyl ester carboxylesterase